MSSQYEAAEISAPSIVVVGLGPAGEDLMGEGSARLLRNAPNGFLRTKRHPASAAFPTAKSLDHHYEAATSFDDVYDGIVKELVACAQNAFKSGTRHPVVYAVPGSPNVAERTVELLRGQSEVSVKIVPALSFLDLAWDRLGIDVIEESVRLIDAHQVEAQLAGERGPFLIAQVHSKDVLSDVKLALLDGGADPTLEIVVLSRLGMSDENVETVRLHQLDQNVTADHLTSLYVEKLGSPIANEVVDLVLLARTLREKCPWDKEQTHHSLGRYLIEESYELLDAIEELTNALKESDTKDAFSVAVTHLEEELGDVLFQVVFHSTLGAEEGYFTLADVARSVTEKLIERHPHVFSDAIRSDADDVARQWETLKKAQKGRTSVLEGIPAALPALSLSATILRKGRGLIATATQESGEKRRALLEKIESATFTKGSPSVLSEDEAGALLWGLVALIGRAGLDPEGVLRHYAQLMIAKVRSLEMPHPGT